MHFSPPNGEISVIVRADAEHAVVEVGDEGPGISPELLARIFEPFVQGPPPAGRPSSGLGIGLSLVKHLVSLHGGEIAVRSGNNGAGSTFSVRLPRISRPALQRAPSAATPSTSGCRVLLVDDNADARETTAQLMRSIGYDVAEAGDGDSALSSALAQVPDVIVMDLEMPNKSGYIVAAELKAMPTLRHVPIIALSGYGQHGDRAASSTAGFAEHLVKPVSIEELARIVETHVGV